MKKLQARWDGRLSKVERRLQKPAPSFLLPTLRYFCGKKVERTSSLLFFSSKKSNKKRSWLSNAHYFDEHAIFSTLSRFEVFLIPTKFGCWRLIFQIILAYTKFNGFEKPPIARSKNRMLLFTKRIIFPPLEGDKGGGLFSWCIFYNQE